MAVQVSILIAAQQLGSSVGLIGSVPTTPANIVASGYRVRLANTDTAAHAVTLYAVASGGPGAANECLPGVSIGPNAYLDVDMPVLGPGGSWQGFADTGAVVTVTQLAGVLLS
jgi:hypothetical protein